MQILTLKPDSWTTNKTISFFSCSKYLVIKLLKLKVERGILAVPTRKQREGITEEVKLKVVSLSTKMRNDLECYLVQKTE